MVNQGADGGASADDADMAGGIEALEAFNKSFDEQHMKTTRLRSAGTLKRRRTTSVEESSAKRPDIEKSASHANVISTTAVEEATHNTAVQGGVIYTQETSEVQGAQQVDEEEQQDYESQPSQVASQNTWGYGYSDMNGYDFNHLLENAESFMTPMRDAKTHLMIASLPILANLSTQILTNLAKGSYDDALTMVTQTNSEPGQAYATLKSLFDQTKKLYSTTDAFLDAYELGLHEPAHSATLRKANLATFVSAVFGSRDVGFYLLNEHFLETFVPEGGKLLKAQGGLFLDLKTQAYISAMAHNSITHERTKADILDDLFPEDMDQRLLARRPGAKQLQPGEIDFLNRANKRREVLMNEEDEGENGKDLTEKYIWKDFLKDVSTYVSKNLETIVSPIESIPAKARTIRRPREYGDGNQVGGTYHFQVPSRETQEPAEISQQEAVDRAARAAQMVLSAELYGTNHDESAQRELSEDHSQNHVENAHADLYDDQIPHADQSAPTQVLYERARLAATAKASPTNRRAGLPSQRRPWTTEEENALMAGLDRVKGPHWSQILAMFGPGGSINESLKDRNQVQLKDKARNLKLFFLKSNIEVPHYLQFVTGDLKTRAPGQAAKNEAKARARQRGDEDRAHIEGVLALAGGGRRDSQSSIYGESASREGTRALSYDEQVAEQLRADQAGQENVSFERGTA